MILSIKGTNMKDFFKRYSYGIVKLFVTQFAIGIFGAVIALATSELDWLLMLTSIGATLFYLFLVYTSVWAVGAKDKISVDVGNLKPNAWRGVLMALVASIPNFIIATLCALQFEATTQVAAVGVVISFFVQGMYHGILRTVPFLGTPTTVGSGENIITTQTPYWFSYFIIIIPLIVVAGLAYFAGTKDFHLTKLMLPQYPESDRDAKPKKHEEDEE